MSPGDVIPWWGWIAIWSGLVIALLTMLAVFAWWLFRKGMVVLEHLDDLARVTELLDGVDDAAPPRARPAVLDELKAVRSARDARITHRNAQRDDRRTTRLARARRITRADASRQQWPADWS